MISLGSLLSRQPAPLLGLDISSSSVKLVELGRDKDGNLVLERCGIEPKAIHRVAVQDVGQCVGVLECGFVGVATPTNEPNPKVAEGVIT